MLPPAGKIALGAAFAMSLPLAALPPLTARAAALFDKPEEVVRVPLPRDPQNPQAKARLSCIYFSRFMVKEVDLGEKGAEQLSILPLAGDRKPVCRRQNAADERVVAADDWSGYFKGVKGDFVFFDADDGWNDGIGFAVVAAASGKKLFDDVAKSIAAVTLSADGVSVRYVRVFGASCSLKADPALSWQQVRRDTALADAAPPDCNALYEKEQRRTPAAAQQVIADPTIIDYEAVATITTDANKLAPVSGTALGCRPAE